MQAAAKCRGVPFKNSKMKDINVRATILAMSIGQKARFPLERYDYVTNCRSRLQFATGRRWTSEIIKEDKEVELTEVDPAEYPARGARV